MIRTSTEPKENSSIEVMPQSNRAIPESKASTEPLRYKTSKNLNSGASFVVSNEFINYTGSVIYLKTQNNLPIALEPSGDHLRIESTQKCLEIRTTYRLSARNSNALTKELIEAMINNGEIVAESARCFYDAINQQAAASSSRGASIETLMNATMTIPINTLKASKSTYVRHCDVVVSERREMMLRPHMNSDEGFHQLNVENARDYHGVSGVFIRIIDNERLLPSRFVYSAKQVVEIPSEVNLNQQSGVYITTAGILQGSVKTTSSFLTFAEAEASHGVYSSHGEAEANGDPEKLMASKLRENDVELSRLKIEASHRESEILRQKHALEIDKQNLERDRQARESELSSLKHILKLKEHDFDATVKLYNEEMERRSLNRRDDFDKRSYKRKDKSEKQSATYRIATDVLKYAPALVLGVMGIYKAVEFSKS